MVRRLPGPRGDARRARHRQSTAARSASPTAAPAGGADRPDAQHLQSRAGRRAGKQHRDRYATLLEAAFMIQRLPAWGTTLGKRITAYPKVHVIDSGLAGWLPGLSAAKVTSRDPALGPEVRGRGDPFAPAHLFEDLPDGERL